MDQELLELLKTVDTPTVCNAIEVVQGKRGFAGYSRTRVVATAPGAPAIVGYTRTAKIAAKSPPVDPADVVKERRLAYYRHMAEAPKPCIVVVEDVDYPHCVGAYWGEINATVHKGFGISGVVTNGLARDLGDLPEGFPIIAGSVGPSHAFVHVTGYGTPVEVFGVSVCEGDLVHADQHGFVVIPPDVVGGLKDGIARLIETEKIVLDAARSPGFDFASLENAWTRFEKART